MPNHSIYVSHTRHPRTQCVTSKRSRSAHPAKRRSEDGGAAAAGGKKVSRGPIRPHVVNIGDANKGKKVRKVKKTGPTSSGNLGRDLFGDLSPTSLGNISNISIC